MKNILSNELILYKYKSLNDFSHVYDVLALKKIFCADLECFNDPNEIINSNPLIDYRSSFIDDLLTFDEPKPFLLSLSGKNGIRSLLWAHYADGYKGVCIKFRFSDTEVNQVIPTKVTYLDTDLPTAADGITKSGEWHYEDEYRFLSFKGEQLSNGHYRPLSDFGLEIEWVEYTDRSISHDGFKRLVALCNSQKIKMVKFPLGRPKAFLTNR